jgi:hypothetical protein
MRCEDVRELISDDAPDDLSREDREALKSHLAGCSDCATLHQTYRVLQEQLGTWQDQPVPAWERVPLMPRAPRRNSFLSTWMPLAAAAVLLLAVAFRTEIHFDGERVNIRFGGPSAEEIKRPERDDAAIKAYVDQAVTKGQAQVLAGMEIMLEDYRAEQDKTFQEVANGLLQKSADERRRDMQTLLARWETQREEDLDVMSQQIRLLMTRQKRTDNDLYQLAGYVQRQPNN